MSDSTCLLLTLPLEIRLLIYQYVSPLILLDTPDSQYSGLLCSCRGIFKELEFEAAKAMTQSLTLVEERMLQNPNRLQQLVTDFAPPQRKPKARFTMPRTLTEMRHLSVSVESCRLDSDLHYHLSTLRLDCLTI